MTTHESSVNFRNLIQDLAEMYPFEVPEVVLVELVANALDAKADRISISLEESRTGVRLVVEDNGEGMTAAQFEEYHDFAAGLKTRGSGIGFAGVGAKISFNVADMVITQTRGTAFSGGSKWYLDAKNRLVWEDMPAADLCGNGTRVEVRFRATERPSYSSTEDIIGLLRRHYLPLTDARFLELYSRLGLYPPSLTFAANGQLVRPSLLVDEMGLSDVREFTPRHAGKRLGYGIFGVAPCDYPVGADVCGVLLCTHGKVIKADLFNQFPGALGPRLLGVVEVPGFIEFLTTNKADFVRRGKHRRFERLYDPVRQEFKSWLRELGVQPAEVTGIDDATRLERELKKLVEDVPELSEFFGFRSRKKVLVAREEGVIGADTHQGIEEAFPLGEGGSTRKPGPTDEGDDPGETLVPAKDAGTERADPVSRAARQGPKITFVDAPDRIELAWVDGNVVALNSAHPCYAKTSHDGQARRLHCLFAIAGAIQQFLGSDGDQADPHFVDRMMAAWGDR